MTAKPARDWKDYKAFVTPEGVDLRLRVGSYIERASAFGIDIALILGLLLLLTIIEAILFFSVDLSGGATQQALLITWLLGAFVLRNLYFTLFELRSTGATPGKRAIGLRVVARDGRRLTADAVIARNAMREVEIFLPLIFLMQRGQGVDGILILLGFIWTGVFLVFPMFNQERLRLGDIAAGTMVIIVPKKALSIDLARRGAESGLRFTQTQLDAYGIKELQVLEQVLRAADRRTEREVSERIRKRIGWDAPMDTSHHAFLQAYYAGLRERLETRMVVTGKRRADKFDR